MLGEDGVRVKIGPEMEESALHPTSPFVFERGVPQVANSGVSNFLNNSLQCPARVCHGRAEFENTEICLKGRSERKDGEECFAPFKFKFNLSR